MLNINFVPEDYVQSSESRRTNLMYLVLFAVVMAVLGGSFVTIKVRQRALNAKEKLTNEKMVLAREAIRQFEELQIKRKAMMKTALLTTELLESVPRSVVLASLTNNLPSGVSFLRLSLVQKEPKRTSRMVSAGRYQSGKARKTAAQPNVSRGGSGFAGGLQNVNRERLLETHIKIEGVAPSDLQVAMYIKQLSNSSLLDNVALVESKEHKAGDTTLRRFKLSATLAKDLHLSQEDIESIRRRDSHYTEESESINAGTKL